MSKMGEISDMAFNNKKKELLDYLETKMSKKAARIGADEFIKAANQIKKRNGEPGYE